MEKAMRVQTTFIFVGPRGGQTRQVGNFSFVSGVCTVTHNTGEEANLSKWFKDYGAYRLGSPDCAAAIERFGVPANVPQAQAAVIARPGSAVASDSRSDLAGKHSGAADGQGHDPASSGSAPRAADWSGQERPTTPLSLREAVERLDPNDDSVWTTAGLPRVDVIQARSNHNALTRREVERASPGWTRDKAREQAMALGL